MAQQQHASGCWWLYDVKKLDMEWQSVCAHAQQQLMKIADSIQKTTYVLFTCSALICKTKWLIARIQPPSSTTSVFMTPHCLLNCCLAIDIWKVSTGVHLVTVTICTSELLLG